MIEGWDKLFPMLKNTTFAEFEQDEAIIVRMVGEAPTKAFMCVPSSSLVISPSSVLPCPALPCPV